MMLAAAIGWLACEAAFLIIGNLVFAGERLELAMIDAIVVVPALYLVVHGLSLGLSRVFAGPNRIPAWVAPVFGIIVGIAFGLIEWQVPLSNLVPRGVL